MIPKVLSSLVVSLFLSPSRGGVHSLSNLLRFLACPSPRPFTFTLPQLFIPSSPASQSVHVPLFLVVPEPFLTLICSSTEHPHPYLPASKWGKVSRRDAGVVALISG